MKKIFGFVLFLTLSFIAFGSIAGTEHDFSGEGWSGGQICLPCHTPHHANSTIAAPLWNHEVTSATFTLYSSTTSDAADIGQPSGHSKLCLSCHDGTIAVDNFGGASGSNYINGSANVGTDLSGDHPISFTYNTALSITDGGLFDPAVTSAVAKLLFGGKVECSSCHNVHGTPYSPLLRIDNSGSALCLTCHDK